MNKRSGKFIDSLRDGFVYCTNISNTYRGRGVLVGSNCSGGWEGGCIPGGILVVYMMGRGVVHALFWG